MLKSFLGFDGLHSSLKTCASLEELENQLDDLPGGLEETYDCILLKISLKHHADVKTFLQWLAFATRPL